MAKSNDITAEGTVLKDVIAIGFGLIYTPLCCSKSLTPDEAAESFTATDGPGTMAGRWVATAVEDLPEGFWGKHTDHTYPMVCNEFPETRYHMVVNC